MRNLRGVALVLALSSILPLLPGCKKSHEDAVQATRAACVTYLAAVEQKADCDKLASLTVAVATPFADVSNDKTLAPADEEYITKCMDAIAAHAETCKDSKAYTAAMDQLMGAIAK